MNKTERIFKIEQLIAARKLVSFQTLLDELEVSRATLKRDLEYLRSRMKTPIVYDRELIGDILRHGAEVEVLAPRELRARCRDQLKAAQKHYASHS